MDPNFSPPGSERLLIEQIRLAFAGVTLGAGIGLWQAEAIDDYDDEEEQAEAPTRDERHDWSRIPSKDLCFSNLCFVDAQGMRFLFPAYMVDYLQRTIAGEGRPDGAMYAVTDLDDFKRSQLTGIDANQRAAVVEFLRWYLSNEETNGGYDSEMITTALREYWVPKE